MSTREIGSRPLFEWVFQEIGELAASHRVPSPDSRTPRSEKGTHEEIAKLLHQKRETITLWLNPTTSSISTEKAKAVQDRLKAKAVQDRLKVLGKPNMADFFELSLGNRAGYFASLEHEGIQRQMIADLESKFIPLLKAITCDGMTDEQTRKVDPPGQVFQEKLRDVVNVRRRATNEPLLRLGKAALWPALGYPDICLALFRALATLEPRDHAPLGIWPSLTPDKKRKWIRHAFGILEVTVGGWERHRDDELWHSPEIDDLLGRLSSVRDSPDESETKHSTGFSTKPSERS